MNSVTVVGRLGADPEITHAAGKTIAKFSLSDKTRKGPQWHKVVAWDKMAELCKQYLKKGHLLSVKGKIVYNTWEKSGQKHTAAEIWIDEMEFLSPRKSEEATEDMPFTF